MKTLAADILPLGWSARSPYFDVLEAKYQPYLVHVCIHKHTCPAVTNCPVGARELGRRRRSERECTVYNNPAKGIYGSATPLYRLLIVESSLFETYIHGLLPKYRKF